MIYFDNAASTKVHPQVLALYSQLLNEYYANQGSSHRLGFKINELAEKSKKSILEQLKLDHQYQVIFTSGATEANNLFLKGAALQYQKRGKKIITSSGEHPSVLKPLMRLRDEYGFTLVILPLTVEGVIDYDELEKEIDDQTIIVSLMSVNNETGAILDVKRIRKMLDQYPKCLFYSDATQSVAKVDVDYTIFDAFCFSAHKINGLKGSGALIIKNNIELIPLIEGGVYEYGFRDGTPDSPKNIVLAKTLKLAFKNHQDKIAQIRHMSTLLKQSLSLTEGVIINTPSHAIPHIINFSLEHHRASVIVSGLSQLDIFVGTTSACSSKSHHASIPVLSMYHDEVRANNVIRVSLGYFNKEEEVKKLMSTIDNLLKETKYDKRNHD